MHTLRTPDERFVDLPDFGYEPRYALVPDQDGGSLRMAWVEAGPPDGPAVLLLHGEPSWSFLYRTMLAPLAAAGLRAIAPDLVGSGRTNKPTHIADHSSPRPARRKTSTYSAASASPRASSVDREGHGKAGRADLSPDRGVVSA